MLASEKRYYSFVREERLFCALLAHLLLQRGSNLITFMELVNAKLKLLQSALLPVTGLEQAEVYLEFAFLRDYWNGLRKDNTTKRAFIFRLLSQVGSIAQHESARFPSQISKFNEYFIIGPHGRAIENDIAYPGQWSVAALDARFSDDSQFREFCRFKWAFNIKPDLVLLIPGSKPLCIEAKLESREGWHPVRDSEAQILDRRFGPQQGRVRQLELQRFMFEKLLGSPCQQVVIGRDRDEYQGVPFLCWVEVFERLDKTGSLPSVEKMIRENIHLNAS